MISKSHSEFQPGKANTTQSSLISKNVTIAKRRTSVRLEQEMWAGLMDICRRERATLHDVCTAIAQYKSKNTSLTAAIRVFIMAYYRTAATEEGHIRAGHGNRLGQATSVPIVQSLMSTGGHAAAPTLIPETERLPPKLASF
jgi:predicted DNA-binding ribbon-helix-helix protein